MPKDDVYIGKIVEYYVTRNGNYFCREENKSLNKKPVDWPVFIPKEIGKNIEVLPVYGIITKERSPWFFNRKSRLTCRFFHRDRSIVKKRLEDSLNFDKSIDDEVARVLDRVKGV